MISVLAFKTKIGFPTRVVYCEMFMVWDEIEVSGYIKDKVLLLKL